MNYKNGAETQMSNEKVIHPMTVKTELTVKDGWKKMAMHFRNAGVEVSEGDKVVGEVCTGMVGDIIILDKERKETWHIGPAQIWLAYLTMRENLTEEDVKEPEEKSE